MITDKFYKVFFKSGDVQIVSDKELHSVGDKFPDGDQIIYSFPYFYNRKRFAYDKKI